MLRPVRSVLRLAPLTAFLAIPCTLSAPAAAQEVGATLPEDEEEEAAAPAPEPEPEGAAPEPEQGPVQSSGVRTHDGFFFRGGVNVGLLMLSADSNPEVDYSGIQLGADIMLGGTLMPGLVLGGALITGRTDNPSVDDGSSSRDLEGSLIFAGLAAFGNYYLEPREGPHLQGLAGFSALDFVSASGASGSTEPRGFFFGFGAGYDFWVGDQWSVGPFGRIVYSLLSAKNDLSFRYFYPSVGAAVTFH